MQQQRNTPALYAQAQAQNFRSRGQDFAWQPQEYRAQGQESNQQATEFRGMGQHFNVQAPESRAQGQYYRAQGQEWTDNRVQGVQQRQYGAGQSVATIPLQTATVFIDHRGTESSRQREQACQHNGARGNAMQQASGAARFPVQAAKEHASAHAQATEEGQEQVAHRHRALEHSDNDGRSLRHRPGFVLQVCHLPSLVGTMHVA